MIMRSRQSFKLIRMSLLDLFRWVITISDPFLTIVDLKWAKIQNDHSNNINIILLSCPKLHVLDVNPNQFHSWLPDLATTLRYATSMRVCHFYDISQLSNRIRKLISKLTIDGVSWFFLKILIIGSNFERICQ